MTSDDLNIETKSNPFQFPTFREGRQHAAHICHLTGILSIHDLSKRSTINGSFAIPAKYLSIHDLPRRSTCLVFHIDVDDCSFNSRPPEEVDKYQANLPAALSSFNSRPPKEVDASDRLRLSSIVFQFTTSRGGRLCRTYFYLL